MSPTTGELTLGGVSLERAFRALRTVEPGAHACYVYDLDAIAARAQRFRDAFAGLGALCAFATKSNSLPAILERLSALGLGADTGSLGELAMAEANGFPADRRVLNGNGRTEEEAAWVAERGVHSVNADHVGELDMLERHAARAGRDLRVALRVNPSIATDGHRYLSTGNAGAKFGVAAAEALEAWAARARWPHLKLDGVHLHVGSQVMDARALDEAVGFALSLAAAAEQRGAPLGLVNLGGGFGVDYTDAGREFPLERFAASLTERVAGRPLDWVFEPGRWISAPAGALVAEVLWIKRRDGKRFVVLGAGMNDLIRPALYGALHRIVPVTARPGPLEPAVVVGPVCESGDVFDAEAMLPSLEPGDLVALLDAGAYGAAMSSNYNGRGRLAELIVEAGRIVRARAAETPEDLLARRRADVLDG